MACSASELVAGDPVYNTGTLGGSGLQGARGASRVANGGCLRPSDLTENAILHPLELVADQVFFILGFLILMGLFEVATGGQYTAEAKMASLIGYLVWRVAGGLMAELSASVANDAQWGTLEQVWLSGLPVAAILYLRRARPSTISSPDSSIRPSPRSRSSVE